MSIFDDALGLAKGAVGTVAGGVPGLVASGAGALAKGGGGMLGGFGGGGNPILGALGGFMGGGGGQGGAGQYQAPASYGTQNFGNGPWPSFPGMPSGNPQGGQHFQGDFSKPGAAETYFDQNKGKWSPGTTQGQTWWNENQGKFGPGVADEYWNGISGRQAPQISNNAQGAYDQFQRSAPADMSSYYDNAVRKTGEGIERAYAARGMRGNSSELDQLSEATGNLRGQEAQANANYGLQRGGLAGNLASGADVSSGRINNADLGWLTGVGNLGLGVQNSDLNRLLGAAGVAGNLDSNTLNWMNSGMNAALGAQGAERTRGQDFFGNNLAAANAQNSTMVPIYLQMLQNDAALQQAAIDASTGYAREGANQSTQGRAQSEQGIGNLFALFGGGKSAGLF